MSVIQEFKDFALKGNVIDLAVGVVIGAAFGKIVGSLVDDVIMPPLGLIIGGIDFSNLFFVLKGEGTFNTLKAAQEAGAVTLNYGLFLNVVLQFLIVAAAIFVVVKQINRFKKEEAAAPAVPPKSEVLLAEIRDLLKK
jgi:large conductance mechanosensitive channel